MNKRKRNKERGEGKKEMEERKKKGKKDDIQKCRKTVTKTIRKRINKFLLCKKLQATRKLF